ncbi:hypothetical protein MVEN_00159700 [Mycena venus]|uniref:F-box domain-containing protein n=1 Tax=Mycena venus TaxID=2733690 RepID=A0A8H7DBI8_9AGAR|nr:hypothetical protein MVEN_00159700 [Mycena venus]
MSAGVSLPRLPVELIDRISGKVETQDLISLALTSWQLNRISIRRMYANVTLEDSEQAMKCFKSLISNVQCAQSVRELTLRFRQIDTQKSEAFSCTLVAAMRNVVALSEINIPWSPEILGFLAETHFPRLRGALIPLSRNTTRFLQLHPNLEELFVQTLTHDPKNYELPIPPLSLPRLTFFSGPDTFAEALVDSSLSRISVYWNPWRKAPASAVYEAISHSGAELLSVYNSISYWDPALLTTIVANAPKVTSLSFDNFGRIYNLGDVETVLARVDDALTKLHHLVHLRFYELNPDDHFSVQGSTLENEFQMVRRWGDRSPTLKRCVFVSETLWLRLSPYVWFPIPSSDGPPEHRMHESWVRNKWFVATVRSSTSLPSEYAALLETEYGKKMVADVEATTRARELWR